jgi:hypothetical protein
MATNIPTHNLGEVIDGCVAYIDNPDIDTDGLMQHIKARGIVATKLQKNSPLLATLRKNAYLCNVIIKKSIKKTITINDNE